MTKPYRYPEIYELDIFCPRSIYDKYVDYRDTRFLLPIHIEAINQATNQPFTMTVNYATRQGRHLSFTGSVILPLPNGKITNELYKANMSINQKGYGRIKVMPEL